MEVFVEKGVADPSSPIELLNDFAQTGNQAAFEEIVRRYAGMVFHVCHQILRNSHDAEDVTQAVFLTLATQCKSNPIKYLGPWLQQVAYRLSLDVRKSHKRRELREIKHFNLNKRNGNGNPIEPPSSAALDQSELKGLIADELNKLPAKYRLPLILHYFGGLSREQIAAELRCKASTLGVRLFRAREMLSQRLAERGITITASIVAVLLASFVRDTVTDHIASSVCHLTSSLTYGAPGMRAAMVPPHLLHLAQSASKALLVSRMRNIACGIVLATLSITATAQIAPYILPKGLFQNLIPAPKLQIPIPIPKIELPELPRLVQNEPKLTPLPTYFAELLNPTPAPQFMVQPVGMQFTSGASNPQPLVISSPINTLQTAPQAPAFVTVKSTPAPSPVVTIKSTPDQWIPSSVCNSILQNEPIVIAQAKPVALTVSVAQTKSTPIPSVTFAQADVPQNITLGKSATRRSPVTDKAATSSADSTPLEFTQATAADDTFEAFVDTSVLPLALLQREYKAIAENRKATSTSSTSTSTSTKSTTTTTPSTSTGTTSNSYVSYQSRTWDLEASTLEGWGVVNSFGTFDNNGLVIANGRDKNRDLSLATVTKVTNSIANMTDSASGWYAVSGGRLILPPISLPAGADHLVWGDSPDTVTLDLVNSLSMDFAPLEDPGQVRISLLSPDRVGISKPDLDTILQIWAIDAGADLLTDLSATIRYDNLAIEQLGKDPTSLQVWKLAGDQWEMADVQSMDFSSSLISFQLDTARAIAMGFDDPALLTPSSSMVVPEPSGMALLGLAGAMLIRRRKAGH